MAAEDKTRDDLNFQKKGVCVMVAPLVETEINGDGAIIGVLPERAIITDVILNVTTESGTASATIDVLVGSDVVANEIDVNSAAGAIVGTVVAAQAYRATGGNVIVKDGSTAPAAGDLVMEAVVQYIELDKNTGEYTEFYEA